MSAPARAKARYRELGPLAQGGMADLCCAEDDSGATVVIKRIRPNLVFDATYRQLFQGEGDLAAALNHPNIVRLLDRGEDDSGPFLVFEQVDGTDLSIVLDAHIEDGRPLELAATFAVLLPLLKGLHAAHEALGTGGEPLQLIHRDVSPGNVLLSEDGDVKLADFGVAKSALKTDETVAGEMKGKFAYMAPEQSRGGDVDRRADLFAVGILLFECLTGRKAFVGPTDADVVQAVREATLPGVAEINRDVPPELAELCERLLHKDREQRPGTALEVADQLQQIAIDLCLESGLRRHVSRLVRLHPRPFAAAKEISHASGPKRRTQKVIQPDLMRPRRRRGPIAFAFWVAVAGLVSLAATVVIGVVQRADARQSERRHVVIERLPDPADLNDDLDEAASDEAMADEEAARELPSFVIGQGDAPVQVAKGSSSTGKRRPIARPPVARPSPTRSSASEPRTAEAGFGVLNLGAKPWAEVSIDGAKIGNTPVIGLRLSAGKHTISLINPHYGIEKTLNVVVPKNGKVQRHVDLTKP